MTLYLLNYNNYYNRLVKKENNLASYMRYVIGNAMPGVNFNPNDGIFTEQIINWPQTNPNPDYLIVADEYNEIISRWFVIEQTRLRNGQYRIMLRRDVIVDNYNDILNAPVFIEKAMLPTSNPLIHNSEGMTYNQILQNKYQLTDDTRVPWVVGYVPRDFRPTAGQPIPVVAQPDTSVDFVVNGISNWEYYRYSNLGGNTMFHPYPENPYLTVRFKQPYYNLKAYTTRNLDVSVYFNQDTDFTVFEKTVNENSTRPLIANEASGTTVAENLTDMAVKSIVQRYFNNVRTTSNWTTLKNALVTYHNVQNASETEYFRTLNNKRILDTSTGITYNIDVVTGNIDNQLKQTNVSILSATGNILKNLIDNYGDFATYNYNDTTFGWSTDEAPLTLRLSTAGVSLHVNPTTERYQLEDAPYDMFAIPAGTISIRKDGLETMIEATVNSAAAIAVSIGATLGSNAVYDIQLLPYCPVRYAITQINELTVTGHPYWSVLDSDNVLSNVILWAVKSSDKFTMSRTISIPSNPIEYKVANECDFNRLVSPNGAGMFEFKPTTNGGVSRIEVDFTYKPFNPFIHLRPNFGNLYGKNYDKDFRGLICGGDFSLPQLSNAWANYQQNNVNYQAIFDRRIENLETNNAVQREKEKWGIATSALGAGLGAGIGSAVAGAGPWGIAIGAAGAGVSALAGMKDYELNEKLRDEAKAYEIDMYNYNLGNIQAIPTALAKTGAMVYNNTIFPTLEYYSCTETEKKALRDKITYNGMTVMVIGTIQQYKQANNATYIKGKLIRCETIEDDFHMVNAIAGELNKGVYI